MQVNKETTSNETITSSGSRRKVWIFSAKDWLLAIEYLFVNSGERILVKNLDSS